MDSYNDFNNNLITYKDKLQYFLKLLENIPTYTLKIGKFW